MAPRDELTAATMIPPEVEALVRARDEARATKDFTRADELRAQIDQAGYVLTDTPGGARVDPKPKFETVDPARVANELSQPATLRFSLHLLYEGFRDDVERFLAAFRRYNDASNAEVVIVDNAGADGEWLEGLDGVRVLHLGAEVGWAAARNAGLKSSRGELIALVDLSVEPTGDVLAPLQEAFADPAVGVAGPFGSRSQDMRDWQPSDGPEVDAIEGYFLATRRALLAKGLVHEKFKWYRNADIDLSFQLRALGARAVVVPLPVRKHAHRGWEALDEQERTKRSKRNHYLFFDRWKARQDLLLANRRA